MQLFFSYRPWDPQNDVSTYENNFIIRTRTRHLTPLIKPVVYGNTAPQDQIRKRSNLLLNTAEPNGEESDEGSGGSRGFLCDNCFRNNI